MVTKIINGKILSAKGIIENQSLYFEDNKILAVTKENMPYDRVIDAGGQYVSPGFIDIHVHGGGGFRRFDDRRARLSRLPEDVADAAVFHLRYGGVPVSGCAARRAMRLFAPLPRFLSLFVCNGGVLRLRA